MGKITYAYNIPVISTKQIVFLFFLALGLITPFVSNTVGGKQRQSSNV